MKSQWLCSEIQAEVKAMANILIVDDSRPSRRILRRVLESAGHVVIDEATDGAEGVEKYLALKPDIVTMDVTMPTMDGMEALEKIIEADPSAKVIMVSALGQSKKISQAVRLGASEYITKPYDADQLIAAIQKVLP
jgi:two-component system chemotaxis response regulator CheY